MTERILSRPAQVGIPRLSVKPGLDWSDFACIQGPDPRGEAGTFDLGVFMPPGMGEY